MTTTQNITVPQGADTVIAFRHFDIDGTTPIDLSTATVRLQARRYWDATSADISLSNGSGIAISGAGNNIASVTFSSTATSAIVFTLDKLNLFYNLEIVISSVVERSFQGILTLTRDINHA